MKIKKKRILFVSDSSRLGGGTNSFLLSLLRYLHIDYDCSVASNRHSSQLRNALEEFGVSHYAQRDRVILFFPALVLLILLGKFDLIYGNGANGRSLWAYRAAKITRRPFIWHIHESTIRPAYVRGLQNADAVIANSRDTAACIRHAANIEPMVIPCGINLQDFDLDQQLFRKQLVQKLGLKPEWLRVVNIGRYCRDKNQMDVIRVATTICSMHPDTYFIFAGLIIDPEYLLELKKEVVAQDLSANIVFLDYTSDVGGLLCGCDIMLHTAQKEPQGLVILEAMAARLPVVAYEVGGVGESILDQQTGFLVPFGNINGLTQSLSFLIRNPGKGKKMGEVGHQHVKAYFSAEETANNITTVIEDTFK